MNVNLAKRNHQFCEQDFIEYPVWATYYEPDDVDALVGFGYEPQELARLLSAIAGNDEYSFPLPPQAANSPFHYLLLGVRATTRSGNRLVGYLTGSCFGVFHNGKEYQFNASARPRALQTAKELSLALGEQAVFPMQVEVMATGEYREEDLW
jgi:hypothetical protein